MLYQQLLREAIPRKNLLPFGIFPNGLDPPPVFLESFKELFFKPYFRQTKVPQNVWILVILPHFSWKMSKPKKKKSSSKCLEFCLVSKMTPPPLDFFPTKKRMASLSKHDLNFILATHPVPTHCGGDRCSHHIDMPVCLRNR